MADFWKRPLLLIPIILMTSFLVSALVLLAFIFVDESLTLSEWYSKPGMVITIWLSQQIAGFDNLLVDFGGDYFLWSFPLLVAMVVWGGLIAILVGTPAYLAVNKRYRHAL